MNSTPLPTRTLGPGGPQVGAIGLGCMGMSWAYNPEDRDDERSIAVIRHALEIGVTLIDTADVYGPFTNEELVGRALEGRRGDAILATKCGLEAVSVEPMLIARNGRPEHVREAIDASLRRLQTDHVDLYQLHRVDPAVPVEETWGAMAEAVAAGKARAIGMSEASVEELDAAHAIHPVASLQSEFSLWERGPVANGVLDWCRRHDAAFIPFSPLGRGFLTGHVTQATITEGDMRATNPRFAPEAMDENVAIVDRVRAVAARHDATPGQVALAWLLAQYDGIVPIPGTRRVERLAENAGAGRLRLSPDDLAELDALPAPAGARYAV
ncbi:MAG TPA: aldo/keto reductase [Solirubrobacteraceae bacterium]|jgi:aryl-alcohol dehydrogenase-like predicted oxidoreductase